MTHTYAVVNREARENVETTLVRRKATDAEAFYLPSGHYEIHTISGKVKVEAPTWVLFDDEGYPYPVAVDIFRHLYEAVDLDGGVPADAGEGEVEEVTAGEGEEK